MQGCNVGREIRDIVNSLERDNPDLSATARVKRAWNASVDSRIREHVTAVFVVPDTAASEVIVYVDSPIWATELGMQVEILRLNLNIELNKDDAAAHVPRRAEQVEKLTFKVSKERYISRERRLTTSQQLEEEERLMRAVEPVALDDDELSDLQEAVSHIENDALRDIAYAAAKANLELQKGIDNAED